MHLENLSSSLIDNSINVMIVDDSSIMRSLLERILNKDNSIKLALAVSNGQEAIDFLISNKSIDIILLDLHMPIMDGLQCIPHLLKVKTTLKIIIVSSNLLSTANIPQQALSLGAFYYIEKPSSREEIDKFSENLLLKIHSLANNLKRISSLSSIMPFSRSSLITAPKAIDNHNNQITLRKIPNLFYPEIIAIASSTGGPEALTELLKGFSCSFLSNKIILITQHIKKDFISLLVSNINNIGNLYCKEASDGELMKKGVIYVAPSDFHLEVQKKEAQFFVHLSDDPPENFCRPSADPMLRSLTRISENILAIILTGIGHDGLAGCMELVARNGVVIAQDKSTSIVWGMPGAVANAGICAAVLPIKQIPIYIERDLA